MGNYCSINVKVQLLERLQRICHMIGMCRYLLVDKLRADTKGLSHVAQSEGAVGL